jgi:ribosome maturation protein SDO1
MIRGALVQPLGQKLLSNVSVVRLDARGHHFEIAVFPNKVHSWREGLETDIDEVVQSHGIFTNVDQGMLAKTAHVLQALSVDTLDEALERILATGTIALAEKERKIKIVNWHRDIATIVASQCVNSVTQRPLTVTLVERAMREIGYSVNLKRVPKAQATRVIRLLQEAHYPISRARIRIKLILNADDAQKATAMIPVVEAVEPVGVQTAVIGQVDPGQLRPLIRCICDEIGAYVVCEILAVHVTSVKQQLNPEVMPTAEDGSGDEGSDGQTEGAEDPGEAVEVAEVSGE